MRYILIVILLIVLSISFLLFNRDIINLNSSSRVQNSIPKVEIVKEFNFLISQNRYKDIIFNGEFNSTSSAKEIANLLSDFKVISKIVIDKSLKDNREVLFYVKKIIRKLIDKNLLEWSIVYRDKKLLIEGKSFDRSVKKAIDTTLLLSNINYFNNIKSIEDRELEVIKTLKEIIPKNQNENGLKKDTIVEDILLPLKELSKEDSSIDEIKKNNYHSHKKRVIKRKHKISKPKITQKKRIIESKKHFKYNKNIKVDKRRVDLKNSDIINLPDVKFVEKEEPFAIKKHVIDEGTIYIPPSNPDEIEPKDVPWARLYDLNEKTNGVFINEPINY